MNFKKRIKKISLLFSGIIAIGVFASCKDVEKKDQENNKEKATKITILQTADIHGQLDAHPELFWENEEIATCEDCGEEVI